VKRATCQKNVTKRTGPGLHGNRERRIVPTVKTVTKSISKARLTGLVALIAGFALTAPATLAGPETKCCEPNTTACCDKCSGTKAITTAKKAKTPKPTKPKAVKNDVTGSHLKQRTVVARFPETTSPVEVWDREVMLRSGEATLSGFLSRQSVFR